MKLEVMNAAEARNLVDNHRSAVTDQHIEKVMTNINNEITRRALSGETDYVTCAIFEMGEVGLGDFGNDRREALFRPIVEALRLAGYTVKVGAGYFGGGYSDFTISW